MSKKQEQEQEWDAGEPPDAPDYTDGTWYVPAGESTYVKRPEYQED